METGKSNRARAVTVALKATQQKNKAFRPAKTLAVLAWTKQVAALERKVKSGNALNSDDFGIMKRFRQEWKQDAAQRDAKDKAKHILTLAEQEERAAWARSYERLRNVEAEHTRLHDQRMCRVTQEVQSWNSERIARFKGDWASKTKRWADKRVAGKRLSPAEEHAEAEGSAIWQALGVHEAKEEAAVCKALINTREAWAAGQLVGWEQRGLQKEDYDFRPWSSGEHGVPPDPKHAHMPLHLGALYEYARETRKLRGLLLMLDPDRKREEWESNYPPSFEGLDEETAKDGLYEMIDALAFLAKPLASNLSFAEVWRSRRKLVERALEHARSSYEFRAHHGGTEYWKMSRGAAVELARNGDLAFMTTRESLWHRSNRRKQSSAEAGYIRPDETPARHVYDGKEVIAVRVNWRDFRDTHLIERFGELVGWLRRTKDGGDGIPPEPPPQKKGKKALVLDKDLACLRVARVLACSSTPDAAWKLLGPGATRSNKHESNYYRYAKEFRAGFKRLFPFEREPAHNRTPRRRSR